MDLKKLNAVKAADLIRAREISSLELVNAVLNEIDANDRHINAYITLNRDSARKSAELIDKKIKEGETLPLLAGVPIAVKDNLSTKGILTTCASKMLENYVPPFNATVINKLDNVGMILLGKLNMDEFAMGSTGETSFFGPVKNPLDLNRVAGGSSSGAAAAVASGEAIIALGSDTGGSIRQPAAYTGIVGFKPTYGSVSRFGLVAYASSLDQIGPVCKTVEDCAAVSDVICGIDKKDSTSLDRRCCFYESLNSDINGLKIGVISDSFGSNVVHDVKTAIENSVGIFKNLGADVNTIELPFLDTAVSDYYIMATAEASSNLSRFDGVKFGYSCDNPKDIEDLFIRSRTLGFGREVRKRIMLGTFVLSSGYFDAYYRKALQVKNLIKSKFDEIFKEYDAIICPTSPTTAPLLNSSLVNPLDMYTSDIFTLPANIAGLPALSVPCGYDSNKMPIGLQIMSQRLNDQTVLNIGLAFQNALKVDGIKENAYEF